MLENPWPNILLYLLVPWEVTGRVHHSHIIYNPWGSLGCLSPSKELYLSSRNQECQ